MKHCISQRRPLSTQRHRGPARTQNSGGHTGDATPRAGGRSRSLQRHWPQTRPRRQTAEHVAWRKDGESCRALTGQRWWPHASKAQVQDARAPPAQPSSNPRRSPGTPADVHRPHLGLQPRKQGGDSTQPLAKARLVQAGLQRPEGPAPHNQPWPGSRGSWDRAANRAALQLGPWGAT